MKQKQAGSTTKPVAAPDCNVVSLVLQGGGALGAYQAGVYQGLHEAGIRPTWLAGISIGALNAAVIAGSPESQRVDRLREFWQTICTAALGWPTNDGLAGALPFAFDRRSARNTVAATQALLMGQSGFFKPRFPPPFLSLFAGDAATSFYDTAPLRDTLDRLVDLDLLNAGRVRVSVGAVNVHTDNLVYFDTAERRLRPEHFMGSGALPPGFAAVEIDGEHYWDGGIVAFLCSPMADQITGSTIAVDGGWTARYPGRVTSLALNVRAIVATGRSSDRRGKNGKREPYYAHP